MRTVILSDLHLGSRNCHAEELLDVLQREPCDRLILNGDTVNGLNLKKFSKQHWAILEHLRQVGRSREMILVRGNHDYDHFVHAPGANGNGFSDRDVLPALLGVPMHEEYRLDIGGQPYLVLHGDRFDPTLNYPVVTEVADWCYQVTQKVNKKLAKWLKKKSKRWGGVLEWVRGQASLYARKQGYAGVLTGHTHFADDARVGETHYVNSGCWTELPCAYITIDDARITVHQLAH
jgi:UDP-2,3-diacylglucosamine pyrophosphatase LpxH